MFMDTVILAKNMAGNGLVYCKTRQARWDQDMKICWINETKRVHDRPFLGSGRQFDLEDKGVIQLQLQLKEVGWQGSKPKYVLSIPTGGPSIVMGNLEEDNAYIPRKQSFSIGEIRQQV